MAAPYLWNVLLPLKVCLPFLYYFLGTRPKLKNILNYNKQKMVKSPAALGIPGQDRDSLGEGVGMYSLMVGHPRSVW